MALFLAAAYHKDEQDSPAIVLANAFMRLGSTEREARELLAQELTSYGQSTDDYLLVVRPVS